MSPRSEELQREEYPMPDTSAGVLELIRQLLKRPGAIEKLVIEHQQPVRVHRWVEPDPMRENDFTLDGALRNSQMLEHIPEEHEGVATTLVRMFARVQYEHLFPVCWVTGPNTERLLAAWVSSVVALGEPEALLGVPVQRLTDLPEETLVLCAANFRDADIKDIRVTVKTAIEVGEQHGNASRQDAHQVGDRSTEHASAAPEVGLPGRRDDREGWGDPGRFLRGRMGKR